MSDNEKRTHERKILKYFFEEVASGRKTFEIRKEDRVEADLNTIRFCEGFDLIAHVKERVK